jgi:mRNA interferase MazF
MKRGEVWIVDLNPIVGHEQAGKRPALILSVLPITSKARNLPSRVSIAPPEGGLTLQSWVICEQPRTISKRRLTQRLGKVPQATMAAVSDVVRMLLGLD